GIPSPQEIGGLLTSHILTVAGIEVRGHPDDGLHFLAGPGIAGTVSTAAAPSLSPGTPKKRTALSPLRWSGVITYVPRRLESQTAFAARSLPPVKAYVNPPMTPPNVAYTTLVRPYVIVRKKLETPRPSRTP